MSFSSKDAREGGIEEESVIESKQGYNEVKKYVYHGFRKERTPAWFEALVNRDR